MRAPFSLPPELEPLVARSCGQFERMLRKELGSFAAMVNVAGWVEQYRDEVSTTVLEAYEKGRLSINAQ